MLTAVLRISRLLSVGVAVALLCGCSGSQASHNANGNTLTGDARDRQLLVTATDDYLEAKFTPNFFGMRRKLLERAKALLEEVLNDDAASPKSKGEAADMLSKVNERLTLGSN
jgi:hypothetical protein